ncbi:MAG: 50S ribosomal protein L11 methyltransferase [Saprospiraceae bacterium]|nr:50S ribosomal protein L11 methyltransferase [Saprospiraceae bacterium]
MAEKEEWLEFKLPLKEYEADLLIALLMDLPFNSFLEEEGNLLAYIKSIDFDNEVKKSLDLICEEYHLEYLQTVMEDKDWNEEWESNFSPVFIDDICTILAPFHKEVEVKGRKILLSPKMAFGTGHHGTTYGMILMMDQLELAGKRILDFGSGTGVLAIFGSMKGATEIDAIDIERLAYDNMLENFALNDITNITAFHGGGDLIRTDGSYDVVLANITANIIKENIEYLSKAVHIGGDILFSGFFENNLDELKQLALVHSLSFIKSIKQGDWVIAHFEKR